MSVKTNELRQAASVNAEDYLLADSPTVGTVRVPLGAAAEYFDAELLKSGTQLHAALSNKAIWNMLPNRNLLDNWYYLSSINQRGLTEYTNDGYIIDRWEKLSGASNKVQVTSDGLVASGSETFHRIIQKIEDPVFLNNKTCCLSVMVKNPDSTLRIALFNKSKEVIHGENFEPSENINVYSFSTSIAVSDGDEVQFIVYMNANNGGIKKSITLLAAKLELGSKQTLAHKEGDVWVLNDPPPNKALELAKCQRYCLSISRHARFAGTVNSNGTSGGLFIPTPVIMRANPSVSGITFVPSIRDASLENATFTSLAVHPGVLIGFSNASGFQGTSSFVGYTSTAGILSADL